MEDRPGKIFVGGLDFDIDEEEFEKIFSKFGKITEVLLKRDQQTNKSRGFGFITYENPSDADEAVKQLDKQDVKGKMVHVDHAVKPGRGGPQDRGGRGGFRSRGGGFRGRGGFNDNMGRGGFSSRGRGDFRGRGMRGDLGGRGFSRGRGGFGSSRGGFDRPRGGFSDDRRGPMTQRRSSLDRGFGDRSVRRDDDRYGMGSSDRDRYSSSLGLTDRRRDAYSPPPRTLDRDLSSYRDSYRDYSPVRDYTSRDRLSTRSEKSSGTNRDLVTSSRDLGLPSRSSYDLGRDTLTSRDSYSRRDDYLSSRETTRDFMSSRESPRDYLTSSRDSGRSLSRDYDRLTRDLDSYRDRLTSSLSRGYAGGSPPRSRSPLTRSAYSPPRSAGLSRDRIRDYSPPSRRPAPYDSPPLKRARPDDGLSGRGMMSRDGPPRGIVREGPMRDSPRGPPRDSMRGGVSSFRR